MSDLYLKVSSRELRLLRWAVREAATWRGQYVGHPDAYEHLQKFDRTIKECRAAVSAARVKRFSP